jgi:hypothetical protein
MNLRLLIRRYVLLYILSLCLTSSLKAQTDLDYDMMNKKLFCSGFMYSYSSWDHYWEGTFKRDNANLGTVSTQMIAYMGAYGITKNLNILFSVPYVKTKASAGTMAGMKGFQDLSLFAKWKPITVKLGKGKLGLYGVAGISTLLSDYTPDFLPLSIGLGSTNVLARAIVDYELGKFFATGSGTYIYRNNINLDRDSYYTTEMHLTDEVEMPNAASFQFRTGYRGKVWIAEAIVNNWTTLGGFDITKNNMPFPSNKMNMTSVGLSFKLKPRALPDLTLLAEGYYTVAGRNVGQSKTVSVSAFYILDFRHDKKSSPKR